MTLIKLGYTNCKLPNIKKTTPMSKINSSNPNNPPIYGKGCNGTKIMNKTNVIGLNTIKAKVWRGFHSRKNI